MSEPNLDISECREVLLKVQGNPQGQVSETQTATKEFTVSSTGKGLHLPVLRLVETISR